MEIHIFPFNISRKYIIMYMVYWLFLKYTIFSHLRFIKK